LTGFRSSRQNATGEKLGVEFLKVDNVDYFFKREIDHWILDPRGQRDTQLRRQYRNHMTQIGKRIGAIVDAA
jgi:hypothetical protein